MSRGAADVFISYAHEDSFVARRIQRDLERLGLRVWRDDSIKGGENIVLRVQEGIEGSTYFVPLMSEHYDRSFFAKEELSAVVMEALSPAQRGIVPVRLDDHAVPALLRARKYCDFRESYLRGLSELTRALGLPDEGPGITVTTEDAVLGFSDDGTTAIWDVDRRFELSHSQSTMRETLVYADNAPTAAKVANGTARVERETGFYVIYSDHDPPLPAMTPLRQVMTWRLEGIYGDPQDFWFYRLPTTFGECLVTVRFPYSRLPSQVVTEFEREGIRQPGPDPAVARKVAGLEYSVLLRPDDARFRSLYWTWDW